MCGCEPSMVADDHICWRENSGRRWSRVGYGVFTLGPSPPGGHDGWWIARSMLAVNYRNVYKDTHNLPASLGSHLKIPYGGLTGSTFIPRDALSMAIIHGGRHDIVHATLAPSRCHVHSLPPHVGRTSWRTCSREMEGTGGSQIQSSAPWRPIPAPVGMWMHPPLQSADRCHAGHVQQVEMATGSPPPGSRPSPSMSPCRAVRLHDIPRRRRAWTWE
nr:hypothetical protein CFP56_70030 [Quercus suber]